MSVTSLSDWNRIELKAQTHELNAVTTPKLPPDTQAQQLMAVTIMCAEQRARICQLKGQINEALLWLSIDQTDRAKQVLARSILDL